MKNIECFQKKRFPEIEKAARKGGFFLSDTSPRKIKELNNSCRGLNDFIFPDLPDE
jgi:hypothetical protein